MALVKVLIVTRDEDEAVVWEMPDSELDALIHARTLPEIIRAVDGLRTQARETDAIFAAQIAADHAEASDEA